MFACSKHEFYDVLYSSIFLVTHVMSNSKRNLRYRTLTTTLGSDTRPCPATNTTDCQVPRTRQRTHRTTTARMMILAVGRASCPSSFATSPVAADRYPAPPPVQTKSKNAHTVGFVLMGIASCDMLSSTLTKENDYTTNSAQSLPPAVGQEEQPAFLHYVSASSIGAQGRV